MMREGLRVDMEKDVSNLHLVGRWVLEEAVLIYAS
jgi:hypothetical protein